MPSSALALRPIPNTNGAIHVWDDQLPDAMSDAQVAFVANHIDGTQKISLDTANRLRAVNPGFLVLYYRLGIGDGKAPFLLDNTWASDFKYVATHPGWFWYQHGRRVFNRQWGWYLMNPDSGWRSYWAASVLQNAAQLGDDGVFADSLSVPQYLGPRSFSPAFSDFVGEAAWTARINRFMRYERGRLKGKLWFIPNAGSWITARDKTDYSIPDGVMVEGFAENGPSSFYATTDWRLQMNRILRLVRRRRIILAQSYLSSTNIVARQFVLGSYLLIKGSRTFLNMDIGVEPHWFPEYQIDLGPPLAPAPSNINALLQPSGLYVRQFTHGTVAVNPTGVARTLTVHGSAELVRPVGGGVLDSRADTSGWGLHKTPVSGSVQVPAHGADVLLRS